MKLYIKILILIFLLFGVIIYLYSSTIFAKEKVNYSFKLESYANELIIKSLIMERSVKKYLITGDESYLVVYQNNYIETQKKFKKILDKTENINKKNNVYNAKLTLDIWKDNIEKEILNRKQLDNSKYSITDIITKVNEKNSKGYFDIFRVKIDDFIATEKALLKLRQEKYYTLFNNKNKLSINLVKENVNSITHTNMVIIEAKELLVYALDMETGMRGYLLTGNDDFLEPYKDGHKNFFKQLSIIKKKVSDNEQQVSAINIINNHMKDWNKNIVKELIRLRKNVGSIQSIDGLIKRAYSDISEKQFNEYKLQIDEFISNLQKEKN